jgi:PucR family transcriptional regulator, purine catabolism regulatory protein
MSEKWTQYSTVLTVGEALALPVLAQGRCVAGAGGLENRIRWVHIVDMPDARYEWGKPDVLLLTTGYGLPQGEDRQAAFVAKLVAERFAGMVLSVGDRLPQTPAALAAQAEALDFPIIELPLHVNFVDVTEAIFERIISQQYRLLQQAGSINQRLTEHVLQGGDLDSLAHTMSGLLQRSITIEDISMRVLATAQHGAVDEARERSVASGHATAELVDRLVAQGIYDRLAHGLQPVYVPAIPELGMTMERIVAPIVVAREMQGYMWIIAGERELTDLDAAAIGHGATVAALVLLQQQAAREAQDALRGDLFERLLQEDMDVGRLSDEARRLGYSPGRAHQVLVLHASPAVGGSPRSALTAVENEVRRGWGQVLPVWREDELVLVIECDREGAGAEMARQLAARFSRPACPLLVALGEVAPGEESIRRSYAQARDAVRIYLLLGKTEGVADFEEVGCLYWLLRMPSEELEDNRYYRVVKNLAAYDEAHNRELLKTLEVYLDCGGSLVQAADALHVHRNTLLQRLERIEEVLLVDLRAPWNRLNLQLALKCLRLK